MAVSNSMLADPDNFRPGVKYKYQETLIGVLNPGDNYIAEKIWESLTSEEVETLERIVKGGEPELYDGMVITDVHISSLLNLKLLTRTSIKSKLSYVACTAKGHMVWESSIKAVNKKDEGERKLYGCYSEHTYNYHDERGDWDPGDYYEMRGKSESLLLVGTSIEDVRNRYNNYIKGKGKSFGISYDPTMDSDKIVVRHCGSNAGGLDNSRYITYIQELEQVG